MNNYGIAFYVALIFGFGCAAGWVYSESDRCWDDEPCPFGLGIVGQKKCFGGRLASACTAPSSVTKTTSACS